ncbi:helicase-related protein, partial [Streptomyces sp. NRRL WC-3549]|uniref:helicase-related protein n=1 Tax=Streptomyces sp. NRRL WC-3549 TaxID=1463925 RepID=UPI0004CAE320
LVDDFAAAPGHAVLLAQIEAGGVGLNMQAASVVVICEPQLKPTVENQAVARAHRMGQVRSVQVHRLLATGGVDERMVAMLENKSRLFDAYARRSEVAESTPDAVDVSDTT